MASKKAIPIGIDSTGMPPADPLDGTEYVHIVQGEGHNSRVTTLQAIADLALVGTAAILRYAATVGALAANPVTIMPCYLGAAGREGWFIFDGSNLAAKVAADGFNGIYIAPTGEDGSTGAWVRRFSGAVMLSWFGVAAGVAATNMVARIESAIDLFGLDALGQVFWLPRGIIYAERDLYIRWQCELRGYGCSRNGSGTTMLFPAGCSGVRTVYVAGTYWPYDTYVHDFRVEQIAKLATSATGNFNAATRTFTITGGTNDFVGDQVVRVEGAAYTGAAFFTLPGITATIANGSAIMTYANVTGGNYGLHNGQIIDIAGAALPAGTTVVNKDYAAGQVQLSAAATAAGAAGGNAAINVKYPLFAKVVSGMGTANLVLDASDGQDAAGVVISHADAGIVPMAPIVVERMDFVTFWLARYLRGGAGSDVPPGAVNFSRFRDVRSGTVWAGAVCCGRDSNSSMFIANDFQNSTAYGFLDLSLIGNIVTESTFAFNVGVAMVGIGQTGGVYHSYFEGGTSYIGNSNGVKANGNMGFIVGSGFAGPMEGAGAGSGGRTHIQDLRVVTNFRVGAAAEFLAGMWHHGTKHAAFAGDIDTYPAQDGGVSSVGVMAVRIGYNAARGSGCINVDDGNVYGPLELDGSFVDFRVSNVRRGRMLTTGLDLEAGKVFSIGGTTVLNGQMAHIADLTAAPTLADFNGLLAALQGVGLMA